MDTIDHADNKSFMLIVQAIINGHFSQEQLEVFIDSIFLVRRVAELTR